MIIPSMRDVEKADLENMGVLLPEGKYLCTIVEVTESEPQDKPHLQFLFSVVGPADYAGQRVRDRVYFTQAAMPIAKAKLEAINYSTDTDRPFAAGDFVGRGVMLTIAHRTAMNSDNLPRVYMDVRVWAKVGEGATAPAAPVVIDPDDDIPF